MTYASDVAFSEKVKEIQLQRGSRDAYARVEQRGWHTTVDDRLASFLAETDSFYLATASASGQPYMQHRGGPRGFLKIIDESTLGFADYRGNRQYITTGNLAENSKAFIFLMDYYNRRRIKLWGTAEVVVADDSLVDTLFPHGYEARPEQAIVFRLSAWDSNCPQHIPQKVPAGLVAEAIAGYEQRVAQLQEEIAQLKANA